MKAYGGDTIEASDGRIGVVRVSQYSLQGKETIYGIMREGDITTPSMHGPTDADRRVAESEIVRILKHGRHDYRPGPKRGYCVRCGVAKREHA